MKAKSFFTRVLLCVTRVFPTKSREKIFRFFRPILFQRILERKARRTALRKAKWDEDMARLRERADSWPGDWAEVYPENCWRRIWPELVIGYNVVSYNSSTYNDGGAEPFARTVTLESALAAARLAGLEVRKYHCLKGCERCDGKGYMINEVTSRRWRMTRRNEESKDDE